MVFSTFVLLYNVFNVFAIRGNECMNDYFFNKRISPVNHLTCWSGHCLSLTDKNRVDIPNVQYAF